MGHGCAYATDIRPDDKKNCYPARIVPIFGLAQGNKDCLPKLSEEQVTPDRALLI